MAEQADSHLTTTSFKAAVESSEVLPSLPFPTTTPVPSAASHGTCFLDPSQAPFPFSGHPPAPPCPFWSEGPRMEHSTQSVTSPVLATEGQSLPQSCWPHCSYGLLPQIHSATWFCSWHRKVHARDQMTAFQTVLITYGLFVKGNKDLLYFSALDDLQLCNTLRHCS